MKIILGTVLGLSLAFLVYVVMSKQTTEPAVIVPPLIQEEVATTTEPTVADQKSGTYIIEGQAVTLINGLAEELVSGGASGMISTEYFGNDLITDLDGDGDKDVVFLLTQSTGGSGVFYYAVSLIATESGYIGGDGYRLGDRIAPQSTQVSTNPRHKNVIVVNYADRAREDTMVAEPSIGKSAYLKLDATTRTWGIVEPDFEGEAR